jgi:DNA-binding SARP family transcriptional activator
MLGSFAVRHEEALVGMPVSLAATALKIVALRRRILVEELVEELWPDSAPGVGMRRLRNVLWRIRVASGDILVREDKFILLSPRAVTDAEIFRRLASQALDPATPADKAADLAENASALYGGELLPADRYADWAAVQRESLARMNIQLIELRVRHAVEEERIAEALGLLEVLMESDPYEEEHYMRAAELHAKIGNRKRAVATLQRAERRLSEFGYPMSAAMRRLADSIS